METAGQRILMSAATVVTAAGASVCCIVPLVVGFLGVCSAAMGAGIAPYRPWFLAATALFLGFAFYQVYRPISCPPEEACAIKARRRRTRILLWIVAGTSAVLMAFPYYVSWLL